MAGSRPDPIPSPYEVMAEDIAERVCQKLSTILPPPERPRPRLLTADEVADILRVPRDKVYGLLERDEGIPHFRVSGGRVRVREDLLWEWIERRGPAGAEVNPRTRQSAAARSR